LNISRECEHCGHSENNASMLCRGTSTHTHSYRRSGCSDTELAATISDMVRYGTGVMKAGKHVPIDLFSSGGSVTISRECAEFHLDRAIISKERCSYPNGVSEWDERIKELKQALQKEES
jgi:hypothetical protein